jgi:hypothetical protein
VIAGVNTNIGPSLSENFIAKPIKDLGLAKPGVAIKAVAALITTSLRSAT